MKIVLAIFALILSNPAMTCDCTGVLFSSPYINLKVNNAEECKSEILSALYQKYKEEKVCYIEESLVVQWSCSSKVEEKVFNCSVFQDLRAAELNLHSIKLLDKGFSPEVSCEESELPKSSPRPKIALNFKDKDELANVLKKFNKSGLKLNVSDTFDKLNRESITFSVTNDNLIGTMGKKGTSNDLGNTHAFHLQIRKNIKDGTYLLVMDYDTALYTQYTNPSSPDYWKLNGVTHVSQHFIEENISKLVIEKAKKGDAFYWQAGFGIQELNKNNSKGDFLFSAAAQQLAFHEFFIKLQQGNDSSKKVITKRYNDEPQEGSSTKSFVEGKAGKPLTLAETKSQNFRAYLNTEVGGRLTGTKGANFASGEASLNVDTKIAGNLALRATAGTNVKIYTHSQKLSEKFIEVTIGTRKYQQGIRYVLPDQKKLPAYLNPVPATVTGRDQLAPKKNSTMEYYFRVLW